MLYSVWSDYPNTCRSARKVNACSACDVNIIVPKNACHLAKEKAFLWTFALCPHRLLAKIKIHEGICL